jgi:predicted glycoside hydrolase/deacetylase ChbG (UPF0249 family)
MRRIVLCADDYALSPGVSAGIRELLTAGRLNATSVMTIFPGLEDEARALQAIKSPIPFQIGLHATLTGGFAPLVASPVKRDAKLPEKLPMAHETWPPLGYRRIDAAKVKAEVKAQIEKFVEVFGRAPDYVDGHQHAQLMPGIRKPFLDAVAALAPRAWVRQCAPARFTDEFFNAKSRFLGLLSLPFKRMAKRRGLRCNPAFSGAYDYDKPGDFGASFKRFIKGMPEGGVVMCHPGHPDDVLRARDPLTDQREREFAFLIGDMMPQALADNGTTLD